MSLIIRDPSPAASTEAAPASTEAAQECFAAAAAGAASSFLSSPNALLCATAAPSPNHVRL